MIPSDTATGSSTRCSGSPSWGWRWSSWVRQPGRRHLAFGWSLVLLVLSLGLWWAFDPGVGTFQFESSTPWIASWGVSYAVALDGISLFMVILTAFTTAVAILGSFNYIKKHEKAFYALMLLMETGVIGVFISIDLFLFYVFWEITLIPMYFIIGVWGGERRIYSAVKFFLFTAFGSLLMLVALLYLFFAAQGVTGRAVLRLPGPVERAADPA